MMYSNEEGLNRLYSGEFVQIQNAEKKWNDRQIVWDKLRSKPAATRRLLIDFLFDMEKKEALSLGYS